MTIAVIARAVFFLGLMLTADSTLGQASKDITVDAIGLCPAEAALRKFPRVTQPTVGIGWTLTKLPDVPLYQSADGTGEIATRIAFNQQLTVFGFSSNDERLFVRTVPSSGKIAICGWVSTDTVLLPRDRKFEGRFKTPQPLQMGDISAEQKKSRNLLNVKAVVHDLSITGESEGGIRIFQDPRSGRSIDKIRLFDAFGVFASMELPAQGSDEETRYWLIGEQIGHSDTTSLKGWIRQRDVVIWPSRLAVQWSEDAIVKGYATPENLKRGVRELTLPERIERADYPEQITRRLPVLEQYPPPDEVFDELPVGGPLEERIATARNLIQYYKIATPGRACRKDNPNDCMTARQIDDERQKITYAEKAAMKIDVLILIDATESMDPYLPTTVRTIDSFVKRAADFRDDYDLRFAISLYGDYSSQEANYEKVDYRAIVPFFKPGPGSQGDSSMRLLVENPKSLLFKDLHRDKLEAPFAAVIRAAKSAHWRPQNEVPLRFLVHIGDAGSRDQGETAASTQRKRYPNSVENQYPPQSTIVEKYGARDVVNALRESGVIYVPVLIEEGSSKKPDPSMWNKIFMDQTNAVLRLLGEDAPAKTTVITHAADPKDTIEKAVADSIVSILSNVKRALDYQKCPGESMTDKCVVLRVTQETFKSPEVVKLVDRVASVAAGLTNEQIKNIYSRDQSIVTMYAPAKAGNKEMFTHWVALEQKEFKLLRDLLHKLCESMAEQDSKNPVTKALHEFSQMYSNEDFADLTVGEIFGKRLGIPNLERTDFSGRTRDEVDDAFRAWQSKGDRETWEKWHYRACKASYFTQLMEDNKKVDPAQIKCNLGTQSCDAPEQAQKKFRWSVQVSQASPVYYIPLDILP